MLKLYNTEHKAKILFDEAAGEEVAVGVVDGE